MNILETAIVTPLLLLLTFGVVDFGALFYGYLALENGVSQATRSAVTGNQTPDPDHPGSMLSRAVQPEPARRPTQARPQTGCVSRRVG